MKIAERGKSFQLHPAPLANYLAHMEYWADVAAAATVKARRDGKLPNLTDEEQFAICLVAGLRPRPGLSAGTSVQLVMPECKILWDDERGRFVVAEDV